MKTFTTTVDAQELLIGEIDSLRAEVERLRAERKTLLAILDDAREQVREGANHGSWWNDRRVYDFDRKIGAVLDVARKAGEEPR